MAAPQLSKDATNVWDENTQTFHGGQDWKFLSNFKEDFSVTTNGLGTPIGALKAAADAIHTIHHYPPADFQPAISHLAEFLWPEKWKENLDLLLMGNGASELIDLVIRSVPKGGWRPGGTLTQYKEYERSSLADDRQTLAWDDKNAALTCLVNPTNPTGDYLNVEEMKQYIEKYCPDNHTIIIDESMQPWVGPHWRQDSLIHQREWVKKLAETRQINVWVMTSWTKIWSCTGIRIGSVVAPTPAHAAAIKRKQVPWSVNSMALAFVSSVVKDKDYMQKTWELTPIWRANLVKLIGQRFPSWVVYGKEYLSWIWVDTKSESTAEDAVRLAKEHGVPVRSGKPGYELPTYVRIAVRNEAQTAYLMKAWSTLK
jgi:histidinol-phosphate/aromatic aminotransferase/cobyric acid decarboxylase-like protein